jgi:hypothetical protein
LRFLTWAVIVLACSAATGQSPVTIPPIDVASAGTSFSRGVRGQAIPSINEFRPPATIGTQMSLDVARGSSIRGVAGGLEADFYDWRTRSNDQRSTTLDYLRFSRDYNASLVITANIRGLAEPDPTTTDPDDRRFYDTSIDTVTTMAADWVRYTNIIAQKYKQGDTIADQHNKSIVDSLVWSTGPTDTHDTLPTRTEAKLPKVTYWEIGNEPRVSLTSSYNFTNSFTFLTPDHTPDSTHKYDYRERYASMTAAMKGVDPAIKVGPAMQFLSAVTEQELLNSILAKQSNGTYLPVDFIGYHPYQKLYDDTTVSGIESRLQSIYSTHASRVANIRSLIAASGRDPNSIELIASETNVSNYTSNGTAYEAEMGHALGTVEEVFSYARLGITASNYWLWPGDPYDYTKQPVYKAYEALRDHMGDTLLNVYSQGDNRLYTTRDSATHEIDLWGLNFSNSASASLQLSLANLSLAGYSAQLMTLRAGGDTTYFSANLPSYLPGGPSNQVDWHTTSLAGVDLSNYLLTLPAATISVLVLTPIQIPGDYDRNGIVDASDYVLWRKTMSQNGANLPADGNHNNVIDAADYTYWRNRFGNNTSATGVSETTIPEPCNLTSILIAAMVICGHARFFLEVRANRA